MISEKAISEKSNIPDRGRNDRNEILRNLFRISLPDSLAEFLPAGWWPQTLYSVTSESSLLLANVYIPITIILKD